MSESSPKNTLVDAQLWARVGKAVISRAGSKLLSIPEQRRAKQPDALRAVGRELLDYLVEQAPESGRFAFETNPLDISKRIGGCPVLAARDGFEHDLVSVQLAGSGGATSARLNLLQSHIKSHQHVFVAHEIQLSPDGSTSHLRIPLRLKYRDSELASDFAHAPADMATLDVLFDRVLFGDHVDEQTALHTIDRFYGAVALMNGSQPPELPEEMATALEPHLLSCII